MVKTTQRGQKIQMPAAIRNKMMAAISMLMVSVIMMVSSSYAWFTLSTAPEVTGITTNVGANGNLEMMLLDTLSYASNEENLGVESNIGDSMAAADQTIEEANVTWGNLVDLSSASYGLSGVVLMPSKLNITGDAAVGGAPLLAPSYGSDGRVIEVNTATYAGKYTSGEWVLDETHAGVRALGTSSGATIRLTVYRSALVAAGTSTTAAIESAKASLSFNAQPLANLMVSKVQGATSFSVSYLNNIKSIIDGVTLANEHIESAIKNAVLAYNLSGANQAELTDEEVTELKEDIEAAELSSLTGGNLLLPAGISDALNTYAATEAALKNASEAYESIKDSTGSLTWNQINTVLQPLVDQTKMKINGLTTSATQDELIAALIPDGDITRARANIVMEEGAGVYYNVASICGQYSVGGQVSVVYNGMPLSAPFTMTQNVDDNNASIKIAISDIQTEGAPESTIAGGTGTKVSLNDTYGYMLDFGFRTNAAGSSLLLQTDAAQRVYNSAGAEASNENTQGSGSYMQFTTSNVNTFSIDEVRALMSAIRVAFVQPDQAGYKLLTMGALDIAQNDDDNDGIITYTGGTPIGTDTLKAALNLYNYEKDASTGILKLGDKITTLQEITALTQNVASKVSVIVYIDGDYVDNTMVANAAQSMYGMLNLQFSSTAALVPMENSGMRAGGTPIISSEVELTPVAGGSTGITKHTVAGVTGVVKSGVTIFSDGNDNYYYSKDGGAKYLLTTSNCMNALDITIDSGNQEEPNTP